MAGDTIDQLIAEVRDLRRQVRALQRLDVAPQTAFPVSYSGTPTAGQLAQWSGAGTITQSGYAGSAVARYSGVPTAGALPYWTGAGTVAAAGFGTADVATLAGTQTLNHKTLGTPTIADFTNAQHNHQSSATGGRLNTAYTIADDNVASFSLVYGCVIVTARDDSTVGCIIGVRSGASPYTTSLGVGSNTNLSTATLTGTTGTDGKFTVSASGSGVIYLENRRGASVTVQVLVF